MKTRVFPSMVRSRAAWAVGLALCLAAPLRAAFVYETPNEFFTAGDFNGDGLPDALVLDKTTGNARVGYGTGGAALSWSAPLVTGVDLVSGCAVGHFKTTTHDTLAVTALTLNRVQLTDLASSNASVSLGASSQSGLGPHSLASLAAPFGAPPPPFGTLLVASSLNDAPAERLDIVTNFPIGFAPSAGQFPESGSFERANAVPISTNGLTFAAGLVRGATNNALHLWQFTNAPAVVAILSNLPPGSDYALGNFNGESLPRFLLYQPGGTNLAIYPLLLTNSTFTFGAPEAVTVAEPLQQVVYLPADTNGAALLVFGDGVQGLRLPNGVPSLSPKYGSGLGAAGNFFTGIVPITNGQFVLFDGPAHGASSAHEQVIQSDGTTFTQRSSANLPAVSSRASRADVWLFQREPFVYRDAGFVASVSAPDWSDAVTGLPAALNAVAEADTGTNSGLGSAASSNLGAPPTGATNGLPNQYNPAISVFSYAAPRAAEPVSILISPPPGPYGSPINITLSWPGTGRQAFYRIDPGGTWQSYTGPFLLTNDATVQYYGQALLSPTRSQVQFASYTFGRPVTGGTNSPIPTIPGNTNVVAVQSTNRLILSPNGTVFYGRVSANTNYTIWAINLDGSSDTYVTTGARPRVSRDGKYLAFLRGGNPLVTQGDIYVRNLQTGAETVLLLSNANYTVGYDWDINCTNLVLDWNCWLWTINADATAAAVLSLPSPDCYDDAPAVNPVDGSLAFQNLNTSSGVNGLYVTSPDRTAKQRLSFLPNGASWPAWSADGQWLAFADGNSISTAFTADGGTNLWIVRPDGTYLNQISGFNDGTNRFPHGAIWTPDNSGLVAAGTIFGLNGLWLIPLTADYTDCDGPPILLPTSPGDAIDFAGSIVVAPSSSVVVSNQNPGLFIRQTPNDVVVYWNTNFAGYTLEAAANLTAPAWASIAGPYYQSGPYFEYWELRSDLQATRFFRLHYTGAMVLSQPPPLGIELETNAAVLTWPASGAGFLLETATNLTPPVAWLPVIHPAVAPTNGQIEIRQGIDPKTPRRFFRLNGP